MKIRILSIACVTTAVALLAACTAAYKNSDACEQLMRSKLAETSPDTLKVTHAGTGIGGSRVVVEGAIEHVETASEVAAAAAASTTKLANAPRAASAGSVASGAAAASASVAGSSAAETASLASAKPQKTTTAAAAECIFHGSSLGAFSWLAPATLVKPAVEAGDTPE